MSFIKLLINNWASRLFNVNTKMILLLPLAHRCLSYNLPVPLTANDGICNMSCGYQYQPSSYDSNHLRTVTACMTPTVREM